MTRADRIRELVAKGWSHEKVRVKVGAQQQEIDKALLREPGVGGRKRLTNKCRCKTCGQILRGKKATHG